MSALGKTDKRIVFVGCVEAGYFCANRLVRTGMLPAAIVSIDSDVATRHGVSGYKDLFTLDVACERYRPRSYGLKDPEDIEFFGRRRFDILIVLGWQRLIPADIIRSLATCGLTIHGSGQGLPKGRGRSPMNWAIIEGYTSFFLSLLTLGAEADSGLILGTKRFDILSTDNIRTLYYKNAFYASVLLEECLPRILSGEITGVEQDAREASYYPKRSPEDGRIDWHAAAVPIERLVRATTKPYPGAFTFCGPERLTIWHAQLFDTQIQGEEVPGCVIAVFPDRAFLAKTGDYYLLVTEYDGHAPKEGDLLS